MESWKWTCTILCIFGFLKDFKPSEPFLTQYLIEPQTVNITLDEAYQDVYPVWTYSYLAVLIVVFLLTDYVKYKPMIIFEGLAFVSTWLLLVFGSGVPLMQLMQFFYGIATSTEVAYYSYIYAKVDADKYQKVTSFTRVATLSAIFLSSVLGQILTWFKVTNYRQLNIISLSSVSLATLVSLFLPKVQNTIYFHSGSNSPLVILRNNFMSSFRQGSVFRWSLWWSLGMAGNYQVGNFIQPLWQSLQHEENETWNGAVEATSTFVGALLALAFAYIKLNWSLVGEFLLILISVLDGFILVAMGISQDIWVAYVGYLLYRPLFQMLITIASFEIARQINSDSCGLVFGINTFLALAFQTILTLIVVEMLALKPEKQFVMYGMYSFGIAGLLLLIFLINGFRKGWTEYFNDLKKTGICIQTKEGVEEDCESRQLSLGGAIEATK